ncbi:putative lipid II flippase FtsW [Candidatus Berkelbacteria bacterium]|nr:putative lipid II flippase FtsW [Candidatus Berkelbacteria bacterium]
MSLAQYRRPAKFRVDGWLLVAVLLLAGLGLMMISSASVVLSSEEFGTSYVYASRQLLHVGLGIVALGVFSFIDYRVWQKAAPILLGLIFLLLFVTFLPGVGDVQQGAQRWLNLGPVQFQPSEVVKVLAILYFSAWLAGKREKLASLTHGFLPFVILLGAIALLILLQPDAGTMMVTLLTIVSMYWVAGAPWTHFLLGGVLGGGLLGILILSAPYRLERLMTFLNPSAETLGAGYHINQALLAIGAGGLFGVGFGQSKQKFLYLPEPHTDSIFAITLEELGFLRALLILAVLVFVILKGYEIAKRAPDPFGRNVAVGITSLIAIQAFINIGAMLGLVPLTGVTLPFMSYGGSSLVSLMVGVGILLNISRHVAREVRT